MCIDAHISGSSSQTLVFSVWDVFLGLRVDVFFRQAEVYDVDGVLPFGARSANQEILGLHVSIDQASGVDELHTRYLKGRGQRTKNAMLRNPTWTGSVLRSEHEGESLTSCMAIMSTVFKEKVLSQRSNRSSRLGPRSSRTIALYLPQGPK